MDTETKAVRDGAGEWLDLDRHPQIWAAARAQGEVSYFRDLLTRFRDFVAERATQWDISKGPCNHHNPVWCEIAEALAAPSAAGDGERPGDCVLVPRATLEEAISGLASFTGDATSETQRRLREALAAPPSQGSDTGEAGRDPKGSDHSRAEPSGALHDAIAEIVQRAGDDPAQHFLRRTIARRNEERAAALKQTAAEPASSAVQGGAGDRTVLPRGAADISASPAPRHENGEAGETGTGSTECIGSVGRQAETPDYLTGFAPYTPVTVRSGTAAPPPTAPQGADLAGLREAHPNVARVLAIPALDIDVIRQSDGLLFGDLRALVSTASAPPAVADREATAEALWRSDNPAEDAAGWREWNAYVEKHGNAPALRREIDACRRRADAVLLALAHPGSVAPTSGERDHETAASRDLLAERRRQVEAEGWTPEHDDRHDTGEMAAAASCYAYVAGSDNFVRRRILCDGVPYRWPWSPEWWKPTDRRRDLVKTGALILAEIERLDRAALSPASRNEGERS